ncbi:MAG: hypothetical protein M1833_000896 [Piccolia ochrophora]|nr:MAG: hypothetical protein M1833_000896 [Piccolia ochrophora]
MARKARQRISYGQSPNTHTCAQLVERDDYLCNSRAKSTDARDNETVLPLASSPGGHRLGVNGLAVDRDQSILYSAGRDGVICAWDLALDLRRGCAGQLGSSAPSASNAPTSTTLRTQTQAHTHWVNDIVLTQDKSALVSASSDLTVKVWRPNAQEPTAPQTVGLHSDYVKCLASPRHQSDWVASGGLDHRICLWDLNGGGERLQINVGDEEKTAKGSVYTMGVGGGLLASGGPESIVRVWDPRTGKRVTKFVGHTDNIRDILVNEEGDVIMTASSDQTVKVWSVTAGRCIYTLTMHSDSVWSLFSDHPRFDIFYSSDRSGLVAKTDVRGTQDMNDGLCIAVCHEQGGVHRVLNAGEHIWTATSSSSINRWADVDTRADFEIPVAPRQRRVSSAVSRADNSPRSSPPDGYSKRSLPLESILRLSNAPLLPARESRDPDSATIQSISSARRVSEALTDAENEDMVPVHRLPEESVEGQNGLIKHVLLNDRKRVLALDTAGEVTLWDLVKCERIQSFGKRHLEDILPEVNTTESVANWCTVDTRTGSLACMLEENYCFDAEIYADQLHLPESIDFVEDQRIKLGKWVLRYLFSNLIDEEIKRDDSFRRQLLNSGDDRRSFERSHAPQTIQLPPPSMASWQERLLNDGSSSTPRATNENRQVPTTPGLSIGVATPAGSHPNSHAERHMRTASEDGNALEKRISQQSQPRSSYDRMSDYFATSPSQRPPSGSMDDNNNNNNGVSGHGDALDDRASQASSDADKEHPKEGGSIFARKFRMSFGSRKSKPALTDVTKPPVVDEKAEESRPTSIDSQEQPIEDNFLGVVQKIRQGYTTQLRESPSQPINSGITPSLPNETPVLKPPPDTVIIIQEDSPDSGGVADLYRGSVASLSEDASLVEKVAPWWLGDLILRNQVPPKETVKVSFVLQPYMDLLPSIASADGNARLNANRMLRARKILAYVAERMEAQPGQPPSSTMKPEDYLELYCQNQLLPPTITLSTLRAYVWKGGGDVMLYYKSNGTVKIVGEKSLAEVEADRANETPQSSSTRSSAPSEAS